MATNAQQLIDLSAYSKKQIDQMTTVVDNEMFEKSKQDEKERLSSMDTKSDEFKKE